MTKCKECGSQISSGATVCPHCGKRRTSLITKIIACLFVFGAIGGMIASNTSENEEAKRVASLTPEQREAELAQKAKQAKIDAAINICESALTKSLNDPNSAELDDSSNWYTTENKDGTILVQPKGRAKNGFGAYVYGVWNCKVIPSQDGGILLSLKQIRP